MKYLKLNNRCHFLFLKMMNNKIKIKKILQKLYQFLLYMITIKQNKIPNKMTNKLIVNKRALIHQNPIK